MVVNSVNFWLFFVYVLFAYYGLFRKSSLWQNITLLVSSYVFYSLVDWRMSLLLLVITVIFYYLGLAIAESKENSLKRSKWLLTFALCIGAGLLLYFKYLNFYAEQFSTLFGYIGLHTNWNTFKIIMPLGISFFTFKLIAYAVEIYRGNMQPCKEPISFGIYISFFPTIMSGPIDDPTKFIPQLQKTRCVYYDGLRDATRRIIWGIFLKMCIADNISSYTSAILGGSPDYNATTIILAMILYSFQIYTDFAGYTEMAIGVSEILGIKVMKNFKRPYFAASVTEFWKRWHISLTKWLTKYVYISMCGNRCSKLRQYWNVMVTFLVSGIWHGANWTFILWGVLHGIYQVIEKMLGLNRYLKNPSSEGLGGARFRYGSVLLTFVLVTLNWCLFQAKNISAFGETLKSLGNGLGRLYIPSLTTLAPALMFILLLICKEFKDEKGWNINLLHSNKRWVFLASCFAVIMTILVFGNMGANNFIYFQF